MPAFGRSMSATPAFGQTSAAAATPFGQTASATPAFGQTASATPVFGQTASATPAFGQTASASSPFGQTASATPAFGQTASATSPFGQTASATPAFGQTASATSPFGQTASATPAFGQTASASSPFGQTASATPIFGQTPSATPAFGQTASTAPAFGPTASTAHAFGQTASTAPAFGQTASIAPAFGPTASTAHAFGQTASTALAFGQTASASSPFGQTASATPAFGQTASTAPAFGQTASASSPFGQTASATPAFGQTASASSPFGQTASATPAFGQTASASSPFGQTASATPVFGQTPSATPVPAFGQTGSAFGKTLSKISAFGSSATPAFGQTAPATSAFGQTASTTPAFGVFGKEASVAPAFGQAGSTPSVFGKPSSKPAFGSNVSATSLFHQAPSSVSLFGQTSLPSKVCFGQKESSAVYIGQPVGTSSTGGMFASKPAFGPTTSDTSVFGQTSPSTVFGHSASTVSTFGSSTMTVSTFGQTITSTSKFGQPTTAPVFGQQQLPNSSAMLEQPAPKLGQTAPAAAAFGQRSTASSMFATRATSASIVDKSATTTSSVFGKPATSVGSTCEKQASPASTIFGKPALSAASVFGKTATPISSTNSSVAPMFVKPASAVSASEQPAVSASEQPTVFGLRPTPSVSTFGKTSIEQAKLSPRQKDHAAVAVSNQKDHAAAGVSNQKSSPPMLFGKPVTSKMKTEKTWAGSQLLFGKKQPASTSAAPSGEPAHAVTSSDRPLSSTTQQRKSASPPGGREQKRAALKRRPAGRLFGRAVAGVSLKRSEKEALGDRSEPPPGQPPPGEGQREGEGEEEKETEDLSPESLQKFGPRRMHRRPSVDINTCVAIKCKNVPASCNKTSLWKHFSKYGVVKRLYSYPSKNTATVHFLKHEMAENASKNGKMIEQDLPPMQIFLTSYNLGESKRRGSTSNLQTVAQMPGRQGRVIHLGRESSARSGEVDKELASMRGTLDMSSQGFGDLCQTQLKKQKSRTLESSRSKKASRDIHTAVGKRKVDGGLDRARAGKTLRIEERMTASTKPAVASDVQPEVKSVSMKSLVNAVGHTTEERLEILNNADKIIRAAQGSTKHANLASAVAIKGSCPDMCPERERYMREFQRRLSVYEIVPGTEGPGQTPVVDHTRAVKEYSRSSADQDMPLPHSVRPPAILQMTMNYLMTDIMDTGGEGRWEDWYDFLWDRTRGIRKDIIQQHLCDESAADLTEKCTRLHIFCSERLCEEDPMIFDVKINNENLTKCLQSLKELYQDLASQHISCHNEAEFRAYMVLMNLNEGDTLREVQELHHEVRDSAHVHFAMAAYAAINSNNYIKFFKLMRRATFLNACIMHRYFTQVRTKALAIIMKAYRVPGHVIQYPLSEIVRHLAFEDKSEAADFCSHHGLAVHDDHVAMDRRAFVQPEQALAVRRAVSLVESKQTTSVGEVVCGGPLPPPTIHQPVSSFDANNRFQVGDLLTSVIEPPTVTTKEPQDQPVVELDPGSQGIQPEPAAAGHAMTVSNEAVKDVAKNIFLEVINEMVLEMCSSLMSDADCCFRNVQSISDELIYDVAFALTKGTCAEVMTELREELEERCRQERVEEDARRRALLSAARDVACSAVIDEIVSDFVDRECSSIAQDQHKEVQQTLQRQCSDRCTISLVDNLVAETITAEMNDIAETTYEVDVEERLRVLEEREKAVELLVKSRYLQCWHNQHAGRMRLKRSMLSFPSAPSMKDLSAQLAALLPASEEISSDSIHLGKKARLTFNSPDQVCETQQRVRLRVALFNYCQRLKHDHSWSPLDMAHVLQRQLTLRQAEATASEFLAVAHQLDKPVHGRRLFWKLVISLPEMDDSSAVDDNHRCDWLKAKFSKGAVPSDISIEGKTEVLSLYTAHTYDSSGCTLNIHVRTAVGILSEADIELFTKKHFLMGCSSLLFLLRTADFTVLDDDFWLEEQLRLKTVLLATPFSSTLPLVILIPHPVSDHQRDIITDQLGLDMIIKDGLISNMLLVAMETSVEKPESSRTLISCVRWMAERCPEQHALKVAPLRDFVEDCLSEDFYTTVFQDLALRKRNGLLHQSPKALITLYNAVVCHMVELVTHPDLGKVSWPQNDFKHCDEERLSDDWNSHERFAALKKMLSFLQLPQVEFGGDEMGDWEEACEDVREFVAAVTAQDGNDTALLSRTSWILQKMKRQSEDMSLTSRWKSECHPCLATIPWTDIILACIDYRMTQMECYNSPESEDETGQEVKVCYFKDHACHVTLPAVWLAATGATHEQHVIFEDTMTLQQGEDDDVSQSPSWIDDIGDKSVTKATGQLLSSIEEEKMASQQFEDKLRKMLQPALPDDLLDITSTDTHNAAAIFGVTSLQSSPIFSLALTSKLDRKQERCVSKCFPQQSLAADVEELNRSLESQKAANALFEMKLRMYMNEDLL